MNQKLQDFLEKSYQEAKAKELEQRKQHLISLGLVDGEEREYNKVRTGKYIHWDKDEKMYFCTRPKPIEVTDEEYELICKYAPYEEAPPKESSGSSTKVYGVMSNINNGAEKYLGFVNTAVFVLSFIVVVFVGYTVFGMVSLYCCSPLLGIVAALFAVIFTLCLIAIPYCWVRVCLNMSNNLHEIRRRVEQITSKNR